MDEDFGEKKVNSKLDIIFTILNIIKRVIIILFYIFIIIYLIKNRGHIGYNDLIKSGYLKKKKIEINKNNFFMIKKKYVGKYTNILLKNENILHYPKLNKNLLHIGDIVFHKTKSLGGMIINYFTNSSFSHIGIMRHFFVDKKNKLNYNVPEGYYLIIPILIGAVKFPSKKDLETKYKNYPIYKFKNSKKSGLFVGDISLNFFVNEQKDELCVIRYKNFTKKNLDQFNEIISSYQFSDYRFGYMLNFAPRTFNTNIFHFFQKIFNYDYYESKKKYFKKLASNITKNKSKDKVSFNKIKGLKNTVKKLYLVQALSKDKSVKNEIKKKIKKLQIIINDIKNNKKFICSEFVYYIYYLIGIDLFRVDRYEIDPILFANFVSPKDIEKTIVKDERFKYICHF